MVALYAASTSSNGAPFGSQDEAAAPATKPGRLDECTSCMAASEQQLLLYAVMPPRRLLPQASTAGVQPRDVGIEARLMHAHAA